MLVPEFFSGFRCFWLIIFDVNHSVYVLFLIWIEQSRWRFSLWKYNVWAFFVLLSFFSELNQIVGQWPLVSVALFFINLWILILKKFQIYAILNLLVCRQHLFNNFSTRSTIRLLSFPMASSETRRVLFSSCKEACQKTSVSQIKPWNYNILWSKRQPSTVRYVSVSRYNREWKILEDLFARAE